jgi:hypothetical protein
MNPSKLKNVRNAENLLIYEVNKIIPLYNSKLKKKYLYDRPFTVINEGEKPNGLKDRYSIYARIRPVCKRHPKTISSTLHRPT